MSLSVACNFSVYSHIWLLSFLIWLTIQLSCLLEPLTVWEVLFLWCTFLWSYEPTIFDPVGIISCSLSEWASVVLVPLHANKPCIHVWVSVVKPLNLNSLHAKCTFICIRDLFSLCEVHIYMHGGHSSKAYENRLNWRWLEVTSEKIGTVSNYWWATMYKRR